MSTPESQAKTEIQNLLKAGLIEFDHSPDINIDAIPLNAALINQQEELTPGVKEQLMQLLDESSEDEGEEEILARICQNHPEEVEKRCRDSIKAHLAASNHISVKTFDVIVNNHINLINVAIMMLQTKSRFCANDRSEHLQMAFESLPVYRHEGREISQETFDLKEKMEGFYAYIDPQVFLQLPRFKGFYTSQEQALPSEREVTKMVYKALQAHINQFSQVVPAMVNNDDVEALFNRPQHDQGQSFWAHPFTATVVGGLGLLTIAALTRGNSQ